jgi:hypothetical protein
MKVYVHYEEGDVEMHLTLKLTLPRRWISQPVKQVVEVSTEMGALSFDLSASIPRAALC